MWGAERWGIYLQTRRDEFIFELAGTVLLIDL